MEAQRGTGVEHTAGIVIDDEGVPRLTRTFTGDLSSASVDWDRARLRSGDTIVGTVHTHPGGPLAEHFSQQDLTVARDFLRDLRGTGYPGVGAQIYVVGPNAGILNFNAARNVITVVP